MPVINKKGKVRYNKVGNKRAGASLLRTPDGAEIQAGVGKLHVGAGFSKRNKSMGVGVSVGKKRVGVHVGLGKNPRSKPKQVIRKPVRKVRRPVYA